MSTFSRKWKALQIFSLLRVASGWKKRSAAKKLNPPGPKINREREKQRKTMKIVNFLSSTVLQTLCFRNVLRLFPEKGNRNKNWGKRKWAMGALNCQNGGQDLRDWERCTTPQQGCRWAGPRLNHNHNEYKVWRIVKCAQILRVFIDVEMGREEGILSSALQKGVQ